MKIAMNKTKLKQLKEVFQKEIKKHSDDTLSITPQAIIMLIDSILEEE